MALLFCDGFDHYTGSGSVKGWVDFSGPRAGYGRWGSYGRSDNNSSWVSVPARQTLIAGVALNRTTSNAYGIFQFMDSGSVQCQLYLRSDGALEVRRGSATVVGQTAPGVIPPGNWSYLEFRATISASGYYEVRVNGVAVLSGTGNLQSTANAHANQVRLQGLWDWLDDFYICDNQGAAANGFLGDVRIYTLYPVSDVVAGWTPSTGSTRWACLDETIMNSDTDYVYSSTAGDEFSCAMSDLPGTVTAVHAVQLSVAHRKDDAGSRAIAPLIRIGAENYEGAQQTCGDAYQFVVRQWSSDPSTGGGWTVSSVNGLAAGARLVS